MSQINPSTDWPLRSNALTGFELFLKQNSVDDLTPEPKEEMVASQLLSDLALSKIDSLTFSGDTLTLSVDGTDFSTTLTSENGIFSLELFNQGFKITLNDNQVFIIDLSTSPILSSSENYLDSAVSYAVGNIVLNENNGDFIITTSGDRIDAYGTYAQIDANNLFRIDMRNGATFSYSLEPYAQNAKLVAINLNEQTYDLSFTNQDTTSISINIADFAKKINTQRIYNNQQAISPSFVSDLLYHYRHIRGYNDMKIKHIHFYVNDPGLNSGSLVLRCETPSTTFNLPALGVGESEKNLDVDLTLDENFYLNIYLDSNSFNISDAPKGLYINIILI